MTFLDVSNVNAIVVSGGAGFAGSHVVECLLERCPQANIRILDALGPQANIECLKPMLATGRVSFFHGDIGNPEIVDRVTAGVDLIVNLAADTSVDRAFANPAHGHAAAVVGVQVLADAMRRNAVPVMLHVSSAAVYGRSAIEPCDEMAALRPLHPLATAQAAAEMILRSQQEAYGLDIRILRPVALYGTRSNGSRMLGRFIDSALRRQPLTIHGTGLQRRCFLEISDFCAAMIAVIERGPACSVYNVGSFDEHSVADIAGMILRQTSPSHAGQVLIRDRPAQDMRRIVRSDALAALGWSPRHCLEDTLPQMMAWQAQRLSPHGKRRFSVVPPLAPVMNEDDGIGLDADRTQSARPASDLA